MDDVAIAAALPKSRNNAPQLKFSDDLLHGPLRDADILGHVAQTCFWLPGEAN